MKKLTVVLILVFLATFILVPTALAFQDSNQDLFNAVTAIIAGLGALVANFVINFLKTLPYLGEPDKDKLAQAVTEVVSVAVGLLTGYVLSLLAQWLGMLPDSNTQALVVSVLTPVLAELRYRLAKLSPK